MGRDEASESAGPGAEFAGFALTAQGLELAFHPAGPDRLAALLALIQGAKASLKLAFYIFDMDATGALVRDALAAAAGRGVAVTLILDGFGANANDAFFAPLIAAGGQLLRFSPHWNVRFLIRNHQKILLADDTAAMIGGFNIADAYFAAEGPAGWADLGVVVRGAGVAPLVEWYAELADWSAQDRARFLAIRRIVRGWAPGSGKVQWLVGGPTRIPSNWAQRVSSDVGTARRLDMVMAYFSPPAWLVRRIGRVPQARLVLAGKSDNAATIGAARLLYGQLLRCGARIFEYEAMRLHTKLIVVDDAVYVGSANFDMRSLYLNLELMLRIEDAALAARVRALIDAYEPQALAVTPALHRQRRTLWNRLRWALSWFLVGVVDYTVTRRLNLGL